MRSPKSVLKVSSRLRLLARAISTLLTRCRALVGHMPYAGRTKLVKTAQIAFHRDGTNTRNPVQQRAHAGRRWRSRRRFWRIGVCRDMQRTATGKLNRAKRTGNPAQFAAYTQAFIQLHGTINAINRINRTNGGARRIFAMVAKLRGGFFFI